METSQELRAALESATSGVPVAHLAAAVRRLSERYRREEAAAAPLLATEADVLAYAAYRMPATYAAGRAALSTLPDLPVSSVLDLGGGTGALGWAVAERYPTARTTIAEQVPAARALGARLAHSGPALEFRAWRLGDPVPGPADLVAASYVLSELTEQQQDQLVDAARAAAGCAVLVVEPGTPGGYRRILRVRTRLLDAGWQIVAPCPHAASCPLAPPDWCHFAARVERSAVHRQLKGGELSYEDEKFSYVAAVAPDIAVPQSHSRVLRHPVKRKGLVELALCRPSSDAGREVVSKKQGPRYRAARDVRWGDTFD